MTSDLFGNTEGEWLELGDSRLGLYRHFVSDQAELYRELTQTLAWDQPEVSLFGKRHRVPRLTAFYGDEGIEYRYSGLVHRAAGWPVTLQTLKSRIDTLLDARFNTVLLNWYRNGLDAMGYHADDEAELGHNPLIASVSLGEPRRFVMKCRNNKNLRRELVLPGGSLLVMAGAFQSEWLHGVPAQKGIAAGRINLTFRRVVF